MAVRTTFGTRGVDPKSFFDERVRSAVSGRLLRGPEPLSSPVAELTRGSESRHTPLVENNETEEQLTGKELRV